MVDKLTIDVAKKLCKQMNVELKLQKGLIENHKAYGIAQPWKQRIYLDPNTNVSMFMTALFHEIQHCINYVNKKYIKYHKNNCTERDYKRIGLRAEIYTDKKAKELAKAFGWTNYKIVYRNSKYWREHFKKGYTV